MDLYRAYIFCFYVLEDKHLFVFGKLSVAYVGNGSCEIFTRFGSDLDQSSAFGYVVAKCVLGGKQNTFFIVHIPYAVYRFNVVGSAVGFVNVRNYVIYVIVDKVERNA